MSKANVDILVEKIGTTEWTRTTDPYHVKVVL
jgi:hypothetical protein